MWHLCSIGNPNRKSARGEALQTVAQKLISLLKLVTTAVCVFLNKVTLVRNMDPDQIQITQSPKYPQRPGTQLDMDMIPSWIWIESEHFYIAGSFWILDKAFPEEVNTEGNDLILTSYPCPAPLMEGWQYGSGGGQIPASYK